MPLPEKTPSGFARQQKIYEISTDPKSEGVIAKNDRSYIFPRNIKVGVILIGTIYSPEIRKEVNHNRNYIHTRKREEVRKNEITTGTVY